MLYTSKDLRPMFSTSGSSQGLVLRAEPRLIASWPSAQVTIAMT